MIGFTRMLETFKAGGPSKDGLIRRFVCEECDAIVFVKDHFCRNCGRLIVGRVGPGLTWNEHRQRWQAREIR